MWLRSSPSSEGDLRDVLELVESDQSPVATALVQPERQVEQRVERGERVGARVGLELDADPEAAERQPETGALEKLLDPTFLFYRTFEVLGVRALEADGDVADRDDAVEVDEHGDEALAGLAVAQRAHQQAGLAVLAGREQADVVPSHGGGKQRARLLVPVDDVVGRERPRVDERVDIGDHAVLKDTKRYLQGLPISIRPPPCKGKGGS